MREIHVNRGTLTTRLAQQETRTFTIHNVDQKPKTLIIEHPERPGFKLLNQKPTETTADAYRFEVKLGARRELRNSRSTKSSFSTIPSRFPASPGRIAHLCAEQSDFGYWPAPASADPGSQAPDRRHRQPDPPDDTEINKLVNDQERVRRNIQSLNQVSGQQEQVQKYARQLATQESQLATLRDHASDLKKQKSTLESNLNTQIEKLDF